MSCEVGEGREGEFGSLADAVSISILSLNRELSPHSMHAATCFTSVSPHARPGLFEQGFTVENTFQLENVTDRLLTLPCHLPVFWHQASKRARLSSSSVLSLKGRRSRELSFEEGGWPHTPETHPLATPAR